MASVNRAQNLTQMDTHSSSGTIVVVAIAATIAAVHLLTNNRYGFHRDELQVLSDALHLDWGFVPYPPLTPFLERIGLAIFGVSLVGLRMFSVIAQAAAILVTGAMAGELGGGRLAQVAAALAVALSPLPLCEGTEFQYTTFDYLWWVLIAYFMIRLLKTENPRWWLAVGATVGVGLMTKYSIIFLVAGILGGLLLTRARRFLGSGWFSTSHKLRPNRNSRPGYLCEGDLPPIIDAGMARHPRTPVPHHPDRVRSAYHQPLICSSPSSSVQATGLRALRFQL